MHINILDIYGKPEHLSYLSREDIEAMNRILVSSTKPSDLLMFMDHPEYYRAVNRQAAKSIPISNN